MMNWREIHSVHFHTKKLIIENNSGPNSLRESSASCAGLLWYVNKVQAASQVKGRVGCDQWKNEIAVIKMPKEAFFNFPIGWKKNCWANYVKDFTWRQCVSRKPLSRIAIYWISPKATYGVLPSWSYLPKIDGTSKGCLIFGPGRPEHWRPQVITNLIAQLLKIHSSHNNLKHFDFFPLE